MLCLYFKFHKPYQLKKYLKQDAQVCSWKFISIHKSKNQMSKKLQDQIAIVTGASSGIGAGCAKEMAKAGAAVVVNYPSDGSKLMAEQVVAEIAANGGRAITYQCDVSK